ncbi:hypothetical protein JTB14_012966 [Gonioctena quinquepunctata]|nr:hypothetical protein JTB14_012966 [Gonioctena quinquepunctata]
MQILKKNQYVLENKLLRELLHEMESKFDILSKNCSLLKDKIVFLTEKLKGYEVNTAQVKTLILMNAEYQQKVCKRFQERIPGHTRKDFSKDAACSPDLPVHARGTGMPRDKSDSDH